MSTAPKMAVSPTTDRRADQVVAESTAPTYEEIARLAYNYWEARGRPHGSPEEDWLRAEQDLLMERSGWKRQPSTAPVASQRSSRKHKIS